MSRRGSEGGRKKSLLDPRRHVKCPVSECKYSGRTDHVKRHFRNLIVWSKTYEGEAAEESENVFISAPRDSKQHTKWCRRNGFTKTKMPYFHSKEQPMSSVPVSSKIHQIYRHGQVLYKGLFRRESKECSML